jgi:general secretion pathway protein I
MEPEPMRDGQRGFTLLEIIIATAIMAIALVAVLQVFSLGVSSARRSQRSTVAVTLARNIMEEVESRDLLESGHEEGVLDDYDVQYSVDITDGELEGLHEVEVAVRWSDEGSMKEYQLFTLIPEETMGFSIFPK